MTMTTFRRFHLDKLLSKTSFYGRVLDLGGKKKNKKGKFRPPMDKVESWEYVNIDAASNPDYICSAESITIKDEIYDIVLMTELLEHLQNPEAALAEASRILKKNGRLICTIPFLHPIHGDPHDFQRWTPKKIEIEFKKRGFVIEKLDHMGGLFAVIYDLLHVALNDASKNRRALKNIIANKCIMPVTAKILVWLDSCYAYKSKTITTGFYVIACKNIEG